MRTIFLLLCLLIVITCQEKEVSKTPRTIYLNPDEARTLVMSEFFDQLEIIRFNGIIYNQVKNILKLDDRYIACLACIDGNSEQLSLYGFDLKGDALYAIGAYGRGPGEYPYLKIISSTMTKQSP